MVGGSPGQRESAPWQLGVKCGPGGQARAAPPVEQQVPQCRACPAAPRPQQPSSQAARHTNGHRGRQAGLAGPCGPEEAEEAGQGGGPRLGCCQGPAATKGAALIPGPRSRPSCCCEFSLECVPRLQLQSVSEGTANTGLPHSLRKVVSFARDLDEGPLASVALGSPRPPRWLRAPDPPSTRVHVDVDPFSLDREPG